MSRALTAEERGVLGELDQMFEALRKQNARKWTDAAIARRFVKFHSSNLGRLRDTTPDGHSKYSGDIGAKIEQLRHSIRSIREYLTNVRDVTSDRKFAWLPQFAAVRDAVTVAQHAESENRLVLVMGATGAGKSALCQQLAAEESAVIVEAKPSWAGSSYSPLQDVCAALQCDRADYETCKRHAEQAALLRLKSYQHILAFDEAATAFDSHTAALLKLFLNVTPTVCVVCGSLDLHARMMRSEQGRQLIRRSVAVLPLGTILSEDVEHFLPFTFEPRERALARAREAALRFGLFDTLVRIRAFLEADHKPGERVPLAELDLAIEHAHKQTGHA